MLASLPVSVLCGIVATRPYDGGLFHHARSGSDWSHHYIRVLMAGELPGLSPTAVLQWLVEGDHDFPPLIHALGAPAGHLIGHGEHRIALLGLLWVVILALAVGSTVRSLSGSTRLGLAAFSATALLPPFHAASLNYYFDLPMTALIWCCIAALIAGQERWPLLAGTLGGVFLFLAGLAKWSALPMAPPLLLGILLCHRQGQASALQSWRSRVKCAVAMGLSTLLLLSAWWRLSTRSWDRMMHMTYGTALDPDSAFGMKQSALQAVLGIIDGLPKLFDPARHLSTEPFAFYSIRGVFCFLSPPLTILLSALFILWLLRSRNSWRLLACTVIGYLCLFTVVIPTLDERFLLTPGPVLLILCLIAWARLSPRTAGSVALLYIGASLWVAWDFHHQPDSGDVGEGVGPEPDINGEFQRIWREVSLERSGIGLQSASDAQWGWRRMDDEQPIYLRLREPIWRELGRCKASAILVEEQLTRTGLAEGLWWAYRNELARLQGEHAFHSIQGFSDRINDVFTGDSLELKDLIWEDRVAALSSYDQTQPGLKPAAPGVLASGWELRAVIDRGPTEGTSHLAIWTPVGSKLCQQWQGGRGRIGPALRHGELESR